MRPRHGFVLGKFMPPHNGHVYLCDFARAYVERLTILVCSLPDDPISGATRLAWMRTLYPDCHVVWCNEVVPQSPEDDPENFWDIWRAIVQRAHPEPIDAVFASESYGHRLAQEVGAAFVPCDPARDAMTCSGTAIRANPFAEWRCIPDVVRPYFVRRVCLFGPESSGKTTLAGALASHYATIVAPEYGRIHTEMFGTNVDDAALRRIVAGHLAGVAAAKRHANRILIEDTDPLLTAVWSDMLLGQRAPWLEAEFEPADLYLLCDIDFPWIDDGTRYFPDQAQRRRFFELCRQELERRGCTFVRVSGSVTERLRQATKAIDARFFSGRQG